MFHQKLAQATDSGRTQPKRPLMSALLSRVDTNIDFVDTEAAAQMLLVEPSTLRKSHSINGHYAGIRPTRLPSRKLAWPRQRIEDLLNNRLSEQRNKEADIDNQIDGQAELRAIRAQLRKA
jgi:hypothetical protein